MAKYSVYGMGNALVDMEYEVSDDFLKEKNIDKGLMTLVEQERQTELLGKLDSHQHKRACGGSAANTMIALSQLGGHGFYSCKVANDESGDFYYQDLKSNGLDTNMNGVREDGVTGKCMVFVTPDAERTMNSFLGISLTLDHQVLDFEALEQSEYLYIEGYLVTSPSAKEAVVKALDFAKEKGIKTALTFSDPSMAKFFGDGLKEMLGGNGVDLLFCNTEEALTFTQTQTLEEAIPELKKWARAFAITRSEKGALLFDGEREIDVHTQQVKPIDTNGAGDLFAGAFMYALTQGHSFGEAGKLACACSSQLVTQFGPRLKKVQAQEIKNTILNND